MMVSDRIECNPYHFIQLHQILNVSNNIISFHFIPLCFIGFHQSNQNIKIHPELISTPLIFSHLQKYWSHEIISYLPSFLIHLLCCLKQNSFVFQFILLYPTYRLMSTITCCIIMAFYGDEIPTSAISNLISKSYLSLMKYEEEFDSNDWKRAHIPLITYKQVKKCHFQMCIVLI